MTPDDACATEFDRLMNRLGARPQSDPEGLPSPFEFDGPDLYINGEHAGRALDITIDEE